MIGRGNIAAKAMEMGGKLSVKSALNPILWLCAIITIPGIFMLIFWDKAPSWLIYVIVAPVITAIIGYVFLLLFDRDKLQSEEYQIKKQTLDLYQIKGQKEPALIDPNEIIEIDNPEKEGE